MNNITSETLRVNLTHASSPTPAYPNTGFWGEAVNALGPVGVSVLGVALLTLFIGVIFFILRKKSLKNSLLATIGVICTFALSLATVIMSTSALSLPVASQDQNVTTLKINATPEGTTTTGDTKLVLDAFNTEEEYSNGFIVYAFTDPNAVLRSTTDPNATISMTQPVDSIMDLSMNSYGVKNEKGGYGSLSIDPAHPTNILDTTTPGAIGTIIPITYAARANTTLPEGTYTTDSSAIHFEIRPNVYSLTYWDGESKDTVKQPHNPNFTLKTISPEDLSKHIGYDFVEYNTEPDRSGTAYQERDHFVADYVESNLYTIWQAKTPTVAFHANGGHFETEEETTKDIKETYDQKYILPTQPTRTGYTFAGWWTQASGGTQVDANTIVKTEIDHTLYAHWTANTHKISYDIKDGSWPAGYIPPQGATYDQDINILNIDAPAGYVFVGWDIEGLDGNTHYYGNDPATYHQTSATRIVETRATYFKNLNATQDSEVRFTAILRPNGYTYTLKYEANGEGVSGLPTSPQSQESDPVFSIPTQPLPTRTGYTFKGYNTAADGSGASYQPGGDIIIPEPASGTTSEQTLYAIWQAKKYDVTFDANGGHFATEAETTKSITETYDQKYILPTEPTREGYEFAGWWTDKTGGTEITATTDVKITDKQTLYAHWTAKKYDVTFDANGGHFATEAETTKKIEETYDQKYILPTQPTRSGYTFAGWWTTTDDTGTQITATTDVKITDKQTLYAHWTAKKYDVTFDHNYIGAPDPEVITETYDQKYILPTQPTRSGYTFAGWWTTTDDTGTQITAEDIVKVTDNTQVLHAHWQVKEIITFDKAYAKAGKVRDEKTNLYKMQDMDSSICNAVTVAGSTAAADTQTGTLVDIRNGGTYTVAKLLDGECWMTDNLALEFNVPLFDTNTDLHSVSSWTPAHATHGGWYDNFYQADSASPLNAPTGAGIYYNWSGAVANNHTDTTEYKTPGFHAPDSICPKGWQLPIGGSASDNQVAKLLTAYGWDSSSHMMPQATTLTGAPLNFVPAGYFVGNVLYAAGGYGGIWTSVVDGNASAYYGYFDPDGIAAPNYGSERSRGQGVRCVVNTNTYYWLKYDANTTEPVSGMPATQLQVNNNSVTISSIIPTRDNYVFKGWAATKDATEADPNLAPGKTISLTADAPEKTLYAVWETLATFDNAYANAGKTKAVATDGKEYYTMQDMDASICNAVGPATSTAAERTQTTTLVDTRDGKTYTVAKLLDGHCWMTQNLALELDKNKSLSDTDTDLHSTTSWVPSHSTSDTWKNDNHHPYSLLSADAPDKSGVYYNWSAAVASNDTSTATYKTKGYQAPDSICPKEWRLPTTDGTASTTSNQMANLWAAYGWQSSSQHISIDTLKSAPLNFVLAGYVDGGTLTELGTNGALWSSAVGSYVQGGTNLSAYGFGFYSSGLAHPNDDAIRALGHSVRCVADANTYYQLKYDANGGSSAPADQTQVNNPTFTISNTTPTYAEYIFLGWASTPDATEADPNLAPGKELALDPPTSGNTSTKTLYAVWKSIYDITFDFAYGQAGKTKAVAADGNSYYTMQDMDASICNIVGPATSTAAEDTQTTTLVDTRDGKTYQAAKLLDGNCWMTENLRLGSATQSMKLTPSDSNISSNWTLPARALDYSWTDSFTTSEIYPSDDIQSDETKGAIGYYGYYYNWNAATAGTGKEAALEAQSDVCPKGWSLPSAYFSKPGRSYIKLLADYGVIRSVDSSLYTTDGWAKMKSPPLQFVLSGGHNSKDVKPFQRGFYGHYWYNISTEQLPENAFKLRFDPTSMYAQDFGYKASGAAIRCLAK